MLAHRRARSHASTIAISRAQALTQQFHAIHLRFDTASAAIPAPSSPDGAAGAFRCPQALVARHGSGGVGLPGSGVPARQHDRSRVAGRTASWQPRVSKAPSAVTLAIC